MLFLLSPAKTLDYQTPVPKAVWRRATQPLFVAQAAELMVTLRRQSVAQVAALMDLSDKLAQLNVQRYADWQAQPTPDNAKPAVLAFDGDVYDGLNAKTLRTAELDWAQQHLVLLSGLYGALRPLDLLQPYRLEMGTALKTQRGANLVAFWGSTVVQHLNQLQAQEASPVVVNLASQEYAQVVLGSAARQHLRARVLDCVFEERQPGGGHKVLSFFAKRARGQMARYAIQNHIRSAKGLQAFALDGYAYSAEASAPDRLVFRRNQAT
jgi:uncharacterized protein